MIPGQVTKEARNELYALHRAELNGIHTGMLRTSEAGRIALMEKLHQTDMHAKMISDALHLFEDRVSLLPIIVEVEAIKKRATVNSAEAPIEELHAPSLYQAA